MRSTVHGAKISVVVCTRNGAGTLQECLAALQRQNDSNYEVLVVDDGSTDTTPEIAREFPYAQYHSQPHSGLSAARNLGAQRATGEIIAYTDDDCVPDEDWLQHLRCAFEDPQCVAAGGPNLPPPPRSFAESVVAMARLARLAEVLLNDEEAEHLPGCNLAIRKGHASKGSAAFTKTSLLPEMMWMCVGVCRPREASFASCLQRWSGIIDALRRALI